MTMKAASLTSSLLAPKGAAAPSGIAPPAPVGVSSGHSTPDNLERDQKSLREQVAALSSSFAKEETAARDATAGNTPASRVTKVVERSVAQRKKTGTRRRKVKAAVKPKLDDLGRIKMSLRLNEKRHLMLKLASAHLSTSAQELLVSALDDYLKKVARDISCSQFSALVNRAEGHVHDSSCWAKKA